MDSLIVGNPPLVLSACAFVCVVILDDGLSLFMQNLMHLGLIFFVEKGQSYHV